MAAASFTAIAAALCEWCTTRSMTYALNAVPGDVYAAAAKARIDELFVAVDAARTLYAHAYCYDAVCMLQRLWPFTASAYVSPVSAAEPATSVEAHRVHFVTLWNALVAAGASAAMPPPPPPLPPVGAHHFPMC